MDSKECQPASLRSSGIKTKTDTNAAIAHRSYLVVPRTKMTTPARASAMATNPRLADDSPEDFLCDRDIQLPEPPDELRGSVFGVRARMLGVDRNDTVQRSSDVICPEPSKGSSYHPLFFPVPVPFMLHSIEG